MSRGGSGGRTRVKTARGRTASSNRWLARQLNDPYVRKAKAEGYRSRAAYKLLELDERFNLLRGVKAVVDGTTLTVTAPSEQLAWAAGQWGVARAEAYGVNRVQVGDRAWTRGERGAAESWSTGEPAASPTTVTIQLATP